MMIENTLFQFALVFLAGFLIGGFLGGRIVSRYIFKSLGIDRRKFRVEEVWESKPSPS